MKCLLLMRHAKSDWDADYPTDHERPLNPRGLRAAALMGRFLRAIGADPDLVISSSARRAHHAARLAVEAGGWASPIEVSSELYGAPPAAVLRVVQAQDDALDTLLLVGHQPTWSELAGELVGGAALRFPTAAIGRIDFAVDRWRRVDLGRGRLVWFVTPKLLGRIGLEPGG